MLVTTSNLAELIVKYGIQLEASYIDPETEEETTEAQSWSAFPCATGGVWEDADTLLGVVQLIVNTNETKL